MARDGQLRRGGPRRIGTALGIMRICSPRHLLGPFLLCLCWPRGAEGAEAAARMEISSRGAALPARPRRAKVMRREHHASLSADSAAVGVGQQERENTNRKVQDGTGPMNDGEDPPSSEQDDAPAPVKAPVQFVHVSGPANRVCKGKSLWTGKAADEDDCEQKCADLEACRFISLSSNNLCRLTATCDSTWHQDGKKVWIFSRSRPALVEATPSPTEAQTNAVNTTEDNASNTTEASQVNTTDNSTNATEVVKVNATENTTNATEVVKVNATENTTNATEVVKINMVNASNTSKEVLAFEQQCQDQADPGIEFVNGTTATCPMLRHYCHHPQFGELVRDNCPKACGFCAVELEENSTDNKSNSSICKDDEPSDLPRFEEAGHALSCTMLRHYCELDMSVKMKCKRTCGWCDNPGVLVRPDTELTKANKTDVPPEGWDTAYNACSRRRLLGFCHTRRRRVA